MYTRLLLAAAATLSLLGPEKLGAEKPGSERPFQDQSPSSIKLTVKGDEKIVEVHNVAYQYTGTRISGRPEDERLTLRTTIHESVSLGDMQEPGTVMLEAWPLGVDLKQKPLYVVKMSGTEARTLDDALWVVNLGYEVPEWSILKLGTGQHMFDTHVELLRFSITPEIQTMRYVGVEIPPDDAKDARLKDPHVVAVVSYSSEAKVIREVLITHDNPARARELRSYFDILHSATFVPDAVKKIKISFRAANPRDKMAPVDVVVPLKGDDLNPVAAQLPPGMHAAVWKR
jgi:hypothetical protein